MNNLGDFNINKGSVVIIPTGVTTNSYSFKIKDISNVNDVFNIDGEGKVVVRGITGTQGKVTITSITGLQPVMELGYDDSGGGYQGRIVGSNGIEFYGQNAGTRTVQLQTQGVKIGGTGTLTAGRTLEVVSGGNTSGDVPFELFRTDGTSSLFKMLGDGTLNYNAGASANAYVFFNNTEGITITSRTVQPFITLTSNGSGTNTGPLLSMADSSGNLGSIYFPKNNNTRITNVQTAYTVTHSIKSTGTTGFDDALFENEQVGLFYNNADDLVIKFKKADGTVIIKTIS